MNESLEASEKLLPNKLDVQDVLSLLVRLGYEPTFTHKGVATTKALATPLYYEKAGIVVFPPITDDSNNIDLFDSETTLNRALAENPTLLQGKDLMVFPLLEGQRYPAWSPRNIWVLLCYEMATRIITVIDPTGKERAKRYSLDKMTKTLTTALTAQTLNVENVKSSYYLDVATMTQTFMPNWSRITQTRSVMPYEYSGHWICYFIYQIAQIVEEKDASMVSALIQMQWPKSAEMILVLDGLRERSQHGEVYTVEIEQLVVKCSRGLPSVRENQYYGLNPGEQHDQVSRVFPADKQPNSEHRHTYFNFNFYSMLVLAGGAVALLGLFCLAAYPTASLAVFGIGTTAFLTGALGKCGVFAAMGLEQRPPDPDAAPDFQLV
ncbi:MAG: hypothetical protein NXI01_07235 [Gammaproteobacteria bacterium]|nr:hypothetical protein [Gammaproteobacteria bacterium]